MCIVRNDLLSNIIELENKNFLYIPDILQFEIIRNNYNTVVNSKLQSSMFNLVLSNKDCSGEIDSKTNYVQDIIEVYDNKPFAWWISPGDNTGIETTLFDMGFHKEALEAVMFADLTKLHAGELSSDLTISLVENELQYNQFAEIVATYDAVAADVFRKLYIHNSADSNLRLFVGCFNSTPVTTGALFKYKHGVIFFNLITREEYRNKGFGATMFNYRINEAKKWGCKWGMLTSTDNLGLRFYSKLGFIDTGYRYQCFEYSSLN